MVAEPSQALVDVLRQLALVAGRSGHKASFNDGHERWSLYRAAIDTGAALPLLFDAVSLEPDNPLASGVVGEVLEHVPSEERERWVGVLDPSVRDFSARRAQELDVLESLARGALTAQSVDDLIDSWSDWLQRRAVSASTDKAVLSVVSRKGRTKKVRHAAADALRRL